MATTLAVDGSKSSNALKIEPVWASVRRYFPKNSNDDPNKWFSFNAEEKGIRRFKHGVLIGVTLNSDAKPMHCGAMESSADATGQLYIEPTAAERAEIVSCITYIAGIHYNNGEKCFVIGGSNYTVTTCDCIYFNDNGSASFGWKTKPVGAP